MKTFIYAAMIFSCLLFTALFIALPITHDSQLYCKLIAYNVLFLIISCFAAIIAEASNPQKTL